MINIKELLVKRTNYPLMKNEDKWVTEILISEQQEEWLVVPAGFLSNMRNKRERNAILEKFFVAGIYNVGAPFGNTAVKFDLLHLTRKKQTYINISIFKGKMYDKLPKNTKVHDFLIAAEYSYVYEKYLAEIKDWISSDIIPETTDINTYEFERLSYDEINWNNLSPEYYTKKARQIRCLLQNEQTVKLGDLVEVLQPRVVNEEACGKVIVRSDLKYPFDIDKIAEKKATSVVLQKHDIVFLNIEDAKPYIIMEELAEEIYANPTMFVLRCKEILPEYLYLYLSSEVAQIVIDANKIGCTLHRISKKALEEIPVIMPTKASQIYIEQVQAFTNIEKTYSQYKAKQIYELSLEGDIFEKQSSIEDILSIENARKIRLYDEERVRTLIEDDLNELSNCYRVKAYKAAIILAGSILEAVLIDWLSDIKGVNYFENDYYVTKRDGSSKIAVLSDYINEIKYIERPRWIAEAKKAHSIREKRNLVHAKLYINSDEVNEQMCREVVEYLRDVLNTRISLQR